MKSTGFECLEIRDVTKNVMEPIESKFVKAVRENTDILLPIADESSLNSFEKVAEYLARTAGYVLVKARCC